MRRLALVVALVSSLALLAGCDHEYQINTRKVEHQITSDVEDQGITFAQVDCPDDIKLKVGGTFHCVVKDLGRDQQTLVTVTLENERGEYTWSAN